VYTSIKNGSLQRSFGQSFTRTIASSISHNLVRVARFLLGFAALACAYPSFAMCPFYPTDAQDGLQPVGTRGGLVFIRYLAGALDPPSSASVSSYVNDNIVGLDVDGDTSFSLTDAQIVIRYLLGFRNDALKSGLVTQANSTRITGDEYQIFIENGCTTDARTIVWNSFSRSLISGDIDSAKSHLTSNALAKYGTAIDALAPDLASLARSFSEPIPLIENDVYAEYWISVPEEQTLTAARYVHVIVFVRNMVDGKWKIDAL
jgi:hypothetical protein